MKYVPPSVLETAFNCPHCDVLTTQTWYSLFANETLPKRRRPLIISPERREQMTFEEFKNSDSRKKAIEWSDSMATGLPFLYVEEGNLWSSVSLENCFVSACFECHKLSIWIFDKLAYPLSGEAPPANPDLSEDIRRDYDEASSILVLSPRGAAALIRLAIQKLCKELGQSGENINNDIGALVANGLDPRIQRALDAVRVIGNNAVHPGQIDLRDDRVTAETLFQLTNLIAEKMISEPKHVDEVYEKLPQDALNAIRNRDAKN